MLLNFLNPSPSFFLTGMVLSSLRDGGIGLYCARPTRAFRGRALREQRDRPHHLAILFLLPPGHLISFLLQTSIHEIRVGLIRLRMAGDGVVQAGQQPPYRPGCCANHRTTAY